MGKADVSGRSGGGDGTLLIHRCQVILPNLAMAMNSNTGKYYTGTTKTIYSSMAGVPSDYYMIHPFVEKIETTYAARAAGRVETPYILLNPYEQRITVRFCLDGCEYSYNSARLTVAIVCMRGDKPDYQSNGSNTAIGFTDFPVTATGQQYD